MKKFIRTLFKYSFRNKPLWENEIQRENLRKQLNDFGFYVLSNSDYGVNVLDVYAVEDDYPIDVKVIRYLGDKMFDIKEDQENTLEAQWCIDSETGERVLIDVRTNKEIARKK